MNIDQVLTRGVAEILPTRAGLAKLMSERKITLYQGFDPTGTKLHIGHAVALRKLRQFQDLGHEVIFLIGDGTGQAGDPSGKKSARERFMTRDELRANARDYVGQAGKIVRFSGKNPVKIMYNGDWLNKLNLVDILEIAQNFSVQQMIERDMFQERIKRGESINLREFLYPLLQGYDSVAMKVDLELGGTDQTFNMLAGRTLVKSFLGKEKYVLSVPLLTDSKGTKIGKTEGNVIGLTDEPADFYGKIMALGDDAIIPCLTLLTDTSEAEIEEIGYKIKEGANPLQFKKQLAFLLTEQFNSKKDAQMAQLAFENTFQKGTINEEEILEIKIPFELLSILDILVETKLVDSKSTAKRLLTQKAIEVDGKVVETAKTAVDLTGKPVIIKVGKKKFAKVSQL